jgi:hypothetical protein
VEIRLKKRFGTQRETRFHHEDTKATKNWKLFDQNLRALRVLRGEKNHWHTTVVAGKKTGMSVYQVNKLLYLTDNDPAFRKRVMEEPEAVLNEFRLSEEERSALTSGAVGKLYRMGVHTFLLNHLYRYELFGVNRDNYLSRIREGMPYDPRFEQGNLPVQRFIKG